MTIFSKLFGKKKDNGINTVSGIEALMRSHLKRLQSSFRGRQGADGLLSLCDQLSSSACVSSSASLIHKELSSALSKGTISNTSEFTNDSFVAASVCPWLMPDQCRAHFPGGYLTMLDRLTKPAYSNPEGRHVAHWLYCSDGNQAGIHLTLVPNPKVIRTLVVFAEDFLTTTERRKVGL